MTTRDTTPRLGRGLAALFGDTSSIGSEFTPHAILPTNSLEPGPFQPRTEIDPARLAELTASVRQQGILQPILVRPHPAEPGRYQIIAGERRWRAAQAVGLSDVPVLARKLSDTEAMAASLVENLQRQDLDPIEEAQAYKRLLGEFGLTQDQLGSLVGKSRSHVANTVRLLQLPDGVQAHVQSGGLSAGHARALLVHPSPETAARTVMARGLNVRQTETFAQRSLQPPQPAKVVPSKDREIVALERDLMDRLGLTVQIDADGTAGTIRIQYKTLDQLDGILALLKPG